MSFSLDAIGGVVLLDLPDHACRGGGLIPCHLHALAEAEYRQDRAGGYHAPRAQWLGTMGLSEPADDAPYSRGSEGKDG